MNKVSGILKIKPKKPLILASQSEARNKILQKSGIFFSIKPSNLDESIIKNKFKNIALDKIAKKLAIAKASQVGKLNPQAVVIGADQICGLGKEIFDKPKTINKAIKQLIKLSGKTHKQYTAACLFHMNKVVWSKIEIASLKMHKLSKKEIVRYINADKPLNSCGSYKLESLGFHLFSSISGSNDTIQGLPLIPLLDALRKHKIYTLKN